MLLLREIINERNKFIETLLFKYESKHPELNMMYITIENKIKFDTELFMYDDVFYEKVNRE